MTSRHREYLRDPTSTPNPRLLHLLYLTVSLFTPPWIHRPRRMETLKTSDKESASSILLHHAVGKDKHNKYRRNKKLKRKSSLKSDDISTKIGVSRRGDVHTPS